LRWGFFSVAVAQKKSTMFHSAYKLLQRVMVLEGVSVMVANGT